MSEEKKLALKLDLQELLEGARAQFQGLDPKNPGQWPILPKILAWLGTTAGVVLVGWFLFLGTEDDELSRELDREPKLKAEYHEKLTQAINLGELKKQKEQVQEYVTQLEKQLPGKAEMDALLSDINQSGLGRGLQFELFKPGQVVVKDYYAELPISIRVTGKYHDIGAFAADVANLSRIVTLHDVSITPPLKDPSGPLTLEAIARTYRYLDANEVNEAKKRRNAKPNQKDSQ